MPISKLQSPRKATSAKPARVAKPPKILKRSKLEEELSLRMRLAGIIQPHEEYRFCKRMWRFDFAWPCECDMIAVEVEGGTWGKSRHTTGKGYEADCEKYSMAAILGWRVIRVTGDMVKDGRATQLIRLAFATNGMKSAPAVKEIRKSLTSVAWPKVAAELRD